MQARMRKPPQLHSNGTGFVASGSDRDSSLPISGRDRAPRVEHARVTQHFIFSRTATL
jgi:hypothetical protein